MTTAILITDSNSDEGDSGGVSAGFGVRGDTNFSSFSLHLVMSLSLLFYCQL